MAARAVKIYRDTISPSWFYYEEYGKWYWWLKESWYKMEYHSYVYASGKHAHLSNRLEFLLVTGVSFESTNDISN